MLGIHIALVRLANTFSGEVVCMTPKTIALRDAGTNLTGSWEEDAAYTTGFNQGYTAGIAEERERSQKLVDALRMAELKLALHAPLSAYEVIQDALEAYEAESGEKTEGDEVKQITMDFEIFEEELKQARLAGFELTVGLRQKIEFAYRAMFGCSKTDFDEAVRQLNEILQALK